ncbi:PD-(D/E)XK nuclease superfamily protein [Orientia chuto str. Dubai]|uniref:PD-(D/E)XK nuclease superfamily protein n=1 Tax=Orientia chuto str. Dubai TaxID=1359168 RepID=A0A0F3MN70_9RICK|nr:PD-(D/E)XK nuclease family protein [Candidatus Orientia mediorientalis]KJV57180.1 PD-(D/E)XK nuclease superfamily protein [Orientia chuto str. Dubai]
MSVYYVKPNDDFIFLLAKFLLKKSSLSLDKIKVILPYSQQCQELKKAIMLTAQKEAMLLPDILTLKQFITSFIATNQCSLSSCCKLSINEQKVALAKIIQQHSYYQIRLSDALKLSGKLLQLFQQLESQQINLNQLKNLVDQIDSSEYWQNTYEFLDVAYTKWSELCNTNISSKNNIFFQLQNLLKFNNNLIVVAGILPSSKLELLLFKVILSCKFSHVILPPIYLEELNYSFRNSSDSLCDFQYFLKSCNILLNDLKYLAEEVAVQVKRRPIRLSEFLDLQNSRLVSSHDDINNIPIDIEYVKVNSQYDEAKLVAAMVYSYLTKDKKILIITTTSNFTTLLTMHLSKYQIDYTNLINADIKQLLEINFILLLADFISSNFSISKFINLINTPLLTSSNSSKFEKLVFKNKFQQGELKQILLDLTTSVDDIELQKWARFVLEALDNVWIYCNSNTILCTKLITYLLQAAENLTVGKIWQLQSSKRIADVLKEIIYIAQQFGEIDIRDFSKILKELFAIIKLDCEHDYNANVTITNADSAVLLSADYIIIPEFSNDNWPGNLIQNPWLNQAIYSKLGLIEQNTYYARKQYILYAILQKAPVTLTNAKFSTAGRSTDSKFFLKLQLLAVSNPLIRIKVNDLELVNNITFNKWNNESTTTIISPRILLSSTDIVKTISATDIELLIRNPYGFYAKNILGLKPITLNSDQLKAAKFGEYIHNVIHEYTVHYQDLEENKQINCFIAIGKQLMDCYNCDVFTKTVWLTKLYQLAEEFVPFDKDRRKQGFRIFSEQLGQIPLNIDNFKLNIVAIADRIEYLQNRECYIIDFKTGIVPSKREVEQGIATQLIIESIILCHGGFKDLPSIIPNKIIYIKIASAKPLLQFTEILVNQEILNKHKLGLKKLIKNYIKEGEVFFPFEGLALKCNNYKHLARYLN